MPPATRRAPAPADVLHALPCFAATAECGFLLYTGRKNSGAAARILAAMGDEPRVSWELPVRSWFVDASLSEVVLLCAAATGAAGADLLGAFNDGGLAAAVQALTGAPASLCPQCFTGNPCERWADVPRGSYTLRGPHVAVLRALAYLPGYGAERGPHLPMVCAPQALTSWAAPPPPAPGAPAGSFWASMLTPADMTALGGLVGRLASTARDRVRKAVADRQRAPRVAAAPPPDPLIAHAAVLGLPWPGPSAADVKTAYRAAAVRAHPDHGGGHAQMAAINAARDALEAALG